MDPFEQGRRDQRRAEAEEDREKRKRAELRRDTARRLYSLLAPKVKPLGFAIWIEDDTLCVHSSENPARHRSDRSFKPSYGDSGKYTMAVRRWGEISGYENDLTDADVLRLVGQYCEENRDAPRLFREYQEQKERERRSWEAKQRWRYWSDHWLLFVIVFGVAGFLIVGLIMK